MENKYRVKTSFSRIDRDELETRRCFYLSVEGNCTEREYFECLERFKKELGLNTHVIVAVLRRQSDDNHSVPAEVIELLDEFINLHNGEIDPETFGLDKNILEMFSKEELKAFLNDEGSLSDAKEREIEAKLKPCGFGLCYRNFVRDYDPEKDIFAAIIDRDLHSHSRGMMEECIRDCEKKGYNLYITNPCFEFWLLMHKSDIRREYGDCLEEIKANRKISNKHTYVSALLSEKAHHGKKRIGFEHNYLPNVDYAMEQSKSFETDKHKLVDNIGSNLAELIENMRK